VFTVKDDQITAKEIHPKAGHDRFARNMFKLELVCVPFLVVGNEYLLGSVDISEQFPSMIKKYLAQGVVDYPDFPGLREAIYTVETAQASTPTASPLTSPTGSSITLTPAPPISHPDSPGNTLSLAKEFKSTVFQRVIRDPIGNGISIVVLLAMLIVFIRSINVYRASPQTSFLSRMQAIIPILCLFGLGVAGYLAYVETAQATAICGPIGDCNTVQQSEYARLFGILPIGLLGVIGHLVILVSWVMTRI